jgi:hypothetical protein
VDKTNQFLDPSVTSVTIIGLFTQSDEQRKGKSISLPLTSLHVSYHFIPLLPCCLELALVKAFTLMTG